MTTQPTFPVLGVPTGMKQAGQRVDFRANQFNLAIETKGYLLVWERANVCPCAPVASQSEQPDPNCTLCEGSGWYYFGAPTAQDLSDYTFDDIQTEILSETGGMVIKGLITGIQNTPDHLNEISNWVDGDMSCTVRSENKLGYYDRLTSLNTEIVYAETITADGTNTLVTRYLATGINTLRSVATTYIPDTNYELSSTGTITWLTTPPVAGTKLAIHYLCHPTWIVVEHPHVARTTSLLFKTPTPATPTGNPVALPVQAKVRYDFLPGPA